MLQQSRDIMHYIEIIIITIIFGILLMLKTETLLTIIIVGLGVVLYIYYYRMNSNNSSKTKTTDNIHELKSLDKNIDFLEILELIRFSKRYDKTKYDSLKDKLNEFMKIYMYILNDRWRIDRYLSTLYFMRLEILEILYSLYVVLPVRMRHVFGFKPLDRLKQVIEIFDGRSKDMIEVVKLYGRHEKGMSHVEDYTVAPYNMAKDMSFP